MLGAAHTHQRHERSPCRGSGDLPPLPGRPASGRLSSGGNAAAREPAADEWPSGASEVSSVDEVRVASQQSTACAICDVKVDAARQTGGRHVVPSLYEVTRRQQGKHCTSIVHHARRSMFLPGRQKPTDWAAHGLYACSTAPTVP